MDPLIRVSCSAGLQENVLPQNRLRTLSLMKKSQFLHQSADRAQVLLNDSCSDVFGIVGLLNVLNHSIHDIGFHTDKETLLS